MCANWAGIGGSLTTNSLVLRVGIIQHFIQLAVRLDTNSKKYHIFARIFWFKTHPRENWFNHWAYILLPDFIKHGPATLILFRSQGIVAALQSLRKRLNLKMFFL